MASNVFPVAVASAGSATAQFVTCVSPNTLYSSTVSLSTGIYQITCTSSTIATLEFYSGTTYIGRATTVSGAVSYNLATAATRVAVSTNTGSDISVGIAKTGENVASISGTLDTITTSGTYNSNATGPAYAIVVGGGGAGGSFSGARNDYNSRGAVGGAGGGLLATYLPALGSSYTVVVGSGGNVVDTSGSAGNAGGTSNLVASAVTYTANGGNGGQNSTPNGPWPSALSTGGTPSGYPGSNALAGPGGQNTNPYNFVKVGNNGGGGNGQAASNITGNGPYPGAGSGIGTGGFGASDYGANFNTGPSGYGAGGGAGGNWSNSSRAAQGGTAGVIYLLRGF
jgi:hypothetical protein